MSVKASSCSDDPSCTGVHACVAEIRLLQPKVPPRAAQEQNNSGALDSIKAHINASVDGAGNKQKHRDALSASDLFSRSVSFFGHDQRVTDKLPPRVCSPDARKLPMSNFHSR